MGDALTFDEAAHAYTLNGRPVPSVTQVLWDLLPSWRASEWYLQRGRAVHACAAMIAHGVAFENDPAIDGQVEACRKFFREIQPFVIEAEERVSSTAYQYAGTLDMACRIGGKPMVVDYKATLTPSVPYQLAAYGMARVPPVNVGLGVELRGDGTYRMSELWDLKRYKQKWLALLTAYNVRRECGIKEEERE